MTESNERWPPSELSYCGLIASYRNFQKLFFYSFANPYHDEKGIAHISAVNSNLALAE